MVVPGFVRTGSNLVDHTYGGGNFADLPHA